MIKGSLSNKSEKDWQSFMDTLMAKKKKKSSQRKAKAFIAIVVFLVAAIVLFNLKTSKPQYLFANIPLKNSQAIIVSDGYAVEIRENTFVLNTGVSK